MIQLTPVAQVERLWGQSNRSMRLQLARLMGFENEQADYLATAAWLGVLRVLENKSLVQDSMIPMRVTDKAGSLPAKRTASSWATKPLKRDVLLGAISELLNDEKKKKKVDRDPFKLAMLQGALNHEKKTTIENT